MINPNPRNNAAPIRCDPAATGEYVWAATRALTMPHTYGTQPRPRHTDQSPTARARRRFGSCAAK